MNHWSALSVYEHFWRRVLLEFRPLSFLWSRERWYSRRTYPTNRTSWIPKTFYRCQYWGPISGRTSWLRMRKASWPNKRSSKRCLRFKIKTFNQIWLTSERIGKNKTYLWFVPVRSRQSTSTGLDQNRQRTKLWTHTKIPVEWIRSMKRRHEFHASRNKVQLKTYIIPWRLWSSKVEFSFPIGRLSTWKRMWRPLT